MLLKAPGLECCFSILWSFAGHIFGQQEAISEVKRIFLLIVALALIALGNRDIWAVNDRYVVAQFTNGTSTVGGGIQTTLSLAVFNDIANLQYPSHFMQRVDVTVPSGFTGSGVSNDRRNLQRKMPSVSIIAKPAG